MQLEMTWRDPGRTRGDENKSRSKAAAELHSVSSMMGFYQTFDTTKRLMVKLVLCKFVLTENQSSHQSDEKQKPESPHGLVSSGGK